jgi:RimJ/RimL family protein N-acetyltransferase
MPPLTLTVPAYAFPEPALVRDEITFRPVVDTDASAYLAGTREDLTARFAWRHPFLDLDAARDWIGVRLPDLMEAGEAIVFGLATAGLPLAGSVMLIDTDWTERRAEVGFWLVPEARGTGIAWRAVDTLCEWAFSLGLERLTALCLPDNVAAHVTVERAAFEREGVLRGFESDGNGGRNDMVCFGRLPQR